MDASCLQFCLTEQERQQFSVQGYIVVPDALGFRRVGCSTKNRPASVPLAASAPRAVRKRTRDIGWIMIESPGAIDGIGHDSVNEPLELWTEGTLRPLRLTGESVTCRLSSAANPPTSLESSCRCAAP
jgi:hypothetical protein